MVKNITQKQIQKATRDGKIISIITYSYRSDERDYIDSILDLYLQEAGRKDLKNKLSYCIHELAGNAKKANTKRVYFAEKGLNIDNDAEYLIGMNNFKEETVRNIRYYIDRLKEHGLYMKFQFQKDDTYIKVAVRNNAVPTRIELERIQNKIEASQKYRDMCEAYALIEDSSEGAGLGLVMMLLMLRGLGLGENSLTVTANGEETVAYIKIPLEKP